VYAYYGLGHVYAKKGKIPEGMDEWNKALEIDPAFLPAKKALLKYSK